MIGALFGESAPGLVGRLVSGLGDIDSAPPSQAIWDLSRLVAASEALTAEFDAGRDGLLDRVVAADDGAAFIAALDAFRFEHGARGPAEWEIASPSWETDPTLVLSLVDRMRLVDESLAPSLRHQAAGDDRAAAVAEAREVLAGDDEAIGTLDLALTMADVFVAGRERTKLTQMMSLHEIRVAADALADRLVAAGHLDSRRELYMATMDELEQVVADPAAWAPTLKERQTDHAALADLQEPFVFIGGEPPMSEWPQRTSSAQPATAGEEMQGVPGSPGVVTGRARVITDPADPRGLEPGEILIAPLTDPAWTPLFIPAGGVIVEVGAPMSHAMIVSREFGVPCVTGIVGVAERIPDGALVQMDGSTGQVTVLEL